MGHIYETAWQIRGYEPFLIDIVERPSWAECLLERPTERNMQRPVVLERNSVRSVTRRLPLSLLVLGLLLIGWATPGQSTWDLLLGEPPAWPGRTAAAVTSDQGEYLAYLPLVQRPPELLLWVDTENREASRTLYLVDYQGSVGIDSGWTGNHATCSAGITAEAFRAAVLRRINYFRSMAGIPAVTGFDATYTAKAQAAGLMMSVNRALSHNPPTSWTCYTEAGREGAGSSNLYLGVYGPEAISGYVYDPGDGNYFVGHRRWILYPQTQFMGTGDIPPRDGYPAANALWVFDRDHMWGPRPETRDEFVAWPPPGYVPYQVVYPRWSFAYSQADLSQATVTMARAGQALTVQLNTPVNGYGENTLVWEPQTSFGSPPMMDTSYQVTVSNVSIGGQAHDFAYTVIVFNPNQQSAAPATDACEVDRFGTPLAGKEVIPGPAQGEFAGSVVFRLRQVEDAGAPYGKGLDRPPGE